MTADLRPFLRLQTDDWLTALRDKVAEDLLANVLTTSFSLNGKASGQTVHVPLDRLAEALTEVLEERGLIPAGNERTARMTVARFC